jgi:hypothetical protein
MLDFCTTSSHRHAFSQHDFCRLNLFMRFIKLLPQRSNVVVLALDGSFDSCLDVVQLPGFLTLQSLVLC